MEDPALKELLLDQPQLMGVESIELDNVNLRMVARTLPGKQFEAGRRLRLLVVAALIRAGIVTSADSSPLVGALVHPATARRRRDRRHRGRCSDEAVPDPQRGPRLAQLHLRPHPHVHRRADHRVHRDLVALRDLPARACAGAGNPDRAAGIHPRPVLHLGAAYRRPAPHHDDHDHADDHRDHDGDDFAHGVHLARRVTDFADLADPDLTHLADDDHAGAARSPAGSWCAQPGADSVTGRPPGQGPMSTPAAPTR